MATNKKVLLYFIFDFRKKKFYSCKEIFFIKVSQNDPRE